MIEKNFLVVLVTHKNPTQVLSLAALVTLCAMYKFGNLLKKVLSDAFNTFSKMFSHKRLAVPNFIVLTKQ